MPKRKSAARKRKKALDGFSAKRPKNAKVARPHDPYAVKKPRGRPAKILTSTVIGRADNCRYQLKQVWNQLEGPLVAAKTEDEVKTALETYAPAYAASYVPFQVADMLALIHSKQFPKEADARINFFADSLGGRPILTFRSSRDVCGRARAKERAKSPYQILCYEYYVECSCGYEGPARNGACRECGAEIPLSAYLHSLS
jgi:hypothetical protein